MAFTTVDRKIVNLRRKGLGSSAIARELNSKNLKTKTGRKWTGSNVNQKLKRLSLKDAPEPAQVKAKPQTSGKASKVDVILLIADMDVSQSEKRQLIESLL